MSSKNNVPIVLKNYHDFIFENFSRFDNVDKVQLELVCQTIFTKLKKIFTSSTNNVQILLKI